MSVQPKAGEMLVGSYLKMVEECEIVAYGQHSPIEGEQMELDVVGLSPGSDQEMFVCEVVTHLHGLDYAGSQGSRDRLWKKFLSDRAYFEEVFGKQDNVRFQLWSPIVRPKLEGLLDDMAQEFQRKHGHELELVLNERYSEQIAELQTKAGSTKAQRNELAFRLLQILAHCREV